MKRTFANEHSETTVNMITYSQDLIAEHLTQSELTNG